MDTLKEIKDLSKEYENKKELEFLIEDCISMIDMLAGNDFIDFCEIDNEENNIKIQVNPELMWDSDFSVSHEMPLRTTHSFVMGLYVAMLNLSYIANRKKSEQEKEAKEKKIIVPQIAPKQLIL